MRYLLPTLYLLIACYFSSNAQQVFKTTNESVIGYLEYLPQGYDSNSDKYPVVFFLHGIGERGANSTDPEVLKTTIQDVAKHGPPMHVKKGVQFPFVLISPQLKSNYGSWTSAYVMEVINHAKTYLRIDEKRIYITGLSLGGGGTWVTAQDNASLFAAIAPVCGGYNSTSAACRLASENLPVWAFHGDADTTVPLSKTVNMVNAINSCSPAPNPIAKVTIYPGVGHNSWSNAYRTDNALHSPNVYQWLMSYTNTINKGNKLPVANAGADISLSSLAPVILNGTGTDSDGTIASYNWSLISGAPVTLLNSLTKNLTVSGLTSGTYVFKLTVKDNSGNTDSDYVRLTVSSVLNTPPVVNAGSDKTITLPNNSVTITGTASDSDGAIASHTWTKVSGGNANMSGTTTATLSLSALVEGSYTFRLTVKDNSGASSYDDVKVTVKAATSSQISANAGADKVLTLPANSLYITGSGTAATGNVIRYYKWSKVSGPSSTLNDVSKQTVFIHSMVEGIYVFRLTVTDDKGNKATDDVQVKVGTESSGDEGGGSTPVGSLTANAGPDKVLASPANELHITGNGTAASGNVIRYYKWSRVSGPSSKLSDVSKQTVYIHSMVEGVHVFRLTVTDDKGNKASDDVKVTVGQNSSDDGSSSPVTSISANAGSDRTITLPVNSLSITGSGTAAAGRVIRYYKWTKVSGPSATLNDVSKPTVFIHSMKPGTHIFKLKVTDNEGATAEDFVTVTVKDAVTSSASLLSPSTIFEETIESSFEEDDRENSAHGIPHDAVVVIYNDAGETIFAGVWRPETYNNVLSERGLYIYNVISEGKRIDAGKIYVSN